MSLLEGYDVYSKFSLSKHKVAFINYFEAIILPTGEVQYAVPSHQEKLLSLAFPGLTREEMWEQIPEEADVLRFLLDKTRCISCWTDFHIGEPYTSMQEATLETLIYEGLTK